jgi:triosephosphate isomerase (TIM)
MSKKPRPLVAGNWKMNGLGKSRTEVKKLLTKMSKKRPACDLLLCPPATLLPEFRMLAKGSRLQFGGQNCHAAPSGAHTGDISAQMLADAGAKFVIVGHSERRADHGESNTDVQSKAIAAKVADLSAIICVGETATERRQKKTLRVIGQQLTKSIPIKCDPTDIVIAYEPVWAIGSGMTPTVDQVAEVHTFIRSKLVKRFGPKGQGVRILYGGSVNPGNAAELMAVDNVDGALVGGASLKAKDFWAIAGAF